MYILPITNRRSFASSDVMRSRYACLFQLRRSHASRSGEASQVGAQQGAEPVWLAVKEDCVGMLDYDSMVSSRARLDGKLTSTT